MGETRFTFKRYEKKYLLTEEKYTRLMERLEGHIVPDRYFKSTVCSLYYDTEDYGLIRRSIEGPVYKEKLRLRSYNTPEEDGAVFVELKKKYKGIVYKRRVTMKAREAEAYLAGDSPAPEESQITREIDWFLHENKVKPRVLVACERSAYVLKDDAEFRITFDKNIRWRETELELTKGSRGSNILPEGETLMELKVPGAVPLWLAELLSELRIFPESFSKYGSCYKKELLDKFVNGVIFSA